MIIDAASWILIIATGVFFVAGGGLISSLLNRRALHKIGLDIAHMKANAKATKQAVDYFVAKNGDG